jgi:hypothetical protein
MCARYHAPQELWQALQECRGTMNEEFDYELTPSQWEALKALRTPASRLPRISRTTIDGLIALELAAMNGEAPAITAKGRKVLIRGSSLLLQDLAA